MRERLQSIARAYVAASFISGLAVALCVFLILLFGHAIAQRWQDAAAAAVLAPIVVGFHGVLASLFVIVLAFLPALVVIGIAETARLRAASFYGGAGATVGIVCGVHLFGGDWLWFWMHGYGVELTRERALTFGMVKLVAGVSGLVGGLVYWSIAGRDAGSES